MISSSQHGKKGTAGAFFAADGDEDFLIFGVGFDAGEVVGFACVLVLEHDAAAPADLLVDVFVGRHSEAMAKLSKGIALVFWFDDECRRDCLM